LIEPAGGETAHVVPDQVLVDVPGDDEFILVGDEHHASVPVDNAHRDLGSYGTGVGVNRAGPSTELGRERQRRVVVEQDVLDRCPCLATPIRCVKPPILVAHTQPGH
jgi:hypothetical protein